MQSCLHLRVSFAQASGDMKDVGGVASPPITMRLALCSPQCRELTTCH
ncbi:hypothetical protein [Tabrizicola sp.]|nr:hypothetical protein [Tabrizicola sp.]